MNVPKKLYNIISTCINKIHQMFVIIIFVFKVKLLLIFKYFKSKLHYYNLFIFVKLFCLIILLKSGYDVTSDYLSYPFEYKLIVLDNKYGFDFPSISICTENNILFDKRKIIEYFELNTKWKEFEKILFEEFQQTVNECDETIEKNREISWYAFNYLSKCYLNINRSELFINKIKNLIDFNLNFDETNSLTMNTNELFDCSANIHFRNESFDSNQHKIYNCFKYSEVLKSIYANNDFGICFEFFAKNYSIYLKDNDYIDINIKYLGYHNLFVNAFQEINNRFIDTISKDQNYFLIRERLDLFFDTYFPLFFFVDPKTRFIPHNRDIAFKSTRNSMNADLKLTKSSVELLGKPYMNECINYGEFR